MPLYNGVEFLKDSISSIIGQSFRDWELIIGINGDHTSEEFYKIVSTIKSFGCDKIYPIMYPWKNKTKTLIEMAKISQFDYVALMDVDDHWFPQKLRKQMLFIEKYDVVGTDATYFGDLIGTPKIFQGKLLDKMLYFHNAIINSSVLMKKECAQWNEAWEGLDDYNLWISLLENGKSFFNIPEILIGHRIHELSYFNKNNDGYMQQLKEKMPQLTEEEVAELQDILLNDKWNLGNKEDEKLEDISPNNDKQDQT